MTITFNATGTNNEYYFASSVAPLPGFFPLDGPSELGVASNLTGLLGFREPVQGAPPAVRARASAHDTT